jgi:hypothetical protein
MTKLSFGLFFALAACGTASVIQQTQTGGTLKLVGDQGKANEAAQQIMARHCGPGNYTVVQQGLEPIGTDTYTTERTTDTEHTSRSGRTTQDSQQTQQVTSTRTATEWRIHYSCGAAGGAQPPQPPQPPQPDPNQPPQPDPNYPPPG